MTLKKIMTFFLIAIYIIINIFQCAYATENLEEINQETTNNEMQIYSESAILIESKTGKILYEKNIHDRKYPASTTKILTAILAIENCKMDEMATASSYAVNSLKSGYTKADIQVGESFTIEQLLDVMMIQSANEAATIIAEHISGSVKEFSKLMNEKAKEIGCTDSNFINPNGMHDENHYSSAYDLALIARYCMKNETFRKLANKMECSLPRTEYWQDEQVEEHGERIFKNTNNLLIPENKYYYPYAIGIKSGFTTPAKNCLVSASNKDGFETIAVVLHAETTEDGRSARYVDTINLFEYGYKNYNLQDILKEYPSVVIQNTTNENNIYYEESKPEINVRTINENSIIPFLQIAIGIIFIIISILLLSKKKKSKEKVEYNNLYKFKLNE